ncbi:MAG: phosphoribosyltransferase family protein, partial [Pseudomonadota bacterium]
RNQVALAALAQATAEVLTERPSVHADVLIPVPLHWRRHWVRGFNQALELARPLATRLSLTVDTALLHRRHATPAQSRQSAEARRHNLARAFDVRGDVAGARVILFDDVLTTGATLNAAALALCEAGASHVRVMTCARAWNPEQAGTAAGP